MARKLKKAGHLIRKMFNKCVSRFQGAPKSREPEKMVHEDPRSVLDRYCEICYSDIDSQPIFHCPLCPAKDHYWCLKKVNFDGPTCFRCRPLFEARNEELQKQ